MKQGKLSFATRIYQISHSNPQTCLFYHRTDFATLLYGSCNNPCYVATPFISPVYNTRAFGSSIFRPGRFRVAFAIHVEQRTWPRESPGNGSSPNCMDGEKGRRGARIEYPVTYREPFDFSTEPNGLQMALVKQYLNTLHG